MGFSLKNVFKKNTVRGARAVVFEEYDAASEVEEGEHSVISSGWSNLEAPVPSPFEMVAEEAFLDEGELLGGSDLAEVNFWSQGGREASSGGQASAPPGAWAGVSGGQRVSTWQAPAGAMHPTMDPAAAPLPRCHDYQTARELENRGFRPLSSGSNWGEAPEALPPMDRIPNEQPSGHQPPASERGFHSPFEGDGTSAGQHASQPAPASPFEIDPGSNQAPAGDVTWQSVGTGGGSLPSLPQSEQVASPFEGVSSPQIPSGSFPMTPDRPSGETHPQPGAIPSETQHNLPSSVLEDPREFVEMNVLRLLESVQPEVGDDSAQGIPPSINTRIPMAMLKPQLSSGQVFLNVSDVILGCSPEHRVRVQGYRPEQRIKVPIALIFPNVRGAEPATPLPNPFEKASKGAAGRGAGAVDPGTQKPVAESLPVQPEAPQRPDPSPITDPAEPGQQAADSFGLPRLGGGGDEPGQLNQAPAPQLSPPSQASAPPTPQGGSGSAEAEPADELPETIRSPLAALAPLGSAPPPAEPGNSSASNPPSPSSPLAPLMPAAEEAAQRISTESETTLDSGDSASQVAHEPMPSIPGGWPFDGNEANLPLLEEPVIESLEDLPPLSEDGEAIAPEGLGNIGSVPTDCQATLRGVFLTEGEIDAGRVAAHCSELPGIESCVILGGASTPVAAAAGAGAEAFGDEAGRLHACLLELLDTTGAADSQFLAVRTDQNLVSFFAGGGFAIAVSHAPEGFRPGVQERLAIIARELGNLASQQS